MYRTPSIASGVASKRFRWSDGFCLTMSISGDFQRHTIRRSRKLVRLMRSREEYFVLRRSAAYAGQSAFAAPVGPAVIAPSCATRGKHQIRSTRQIDAQREGKVMEVTFRRAPHRRVAHAITTNLTRFE